MTDLDWAILDIAGLAPWLVTTRGVDDFSTGVGFDVKMGSCGMVFGAP